MATPAMSGRNAKGGLRQYLANKLLDLADKLLGEKQVWQSVRMMRLMRPR